MFPKKQTIIKSYQFKILNNQQQMVYFQQLVEQAAEKLLSDLWSDNWINRLGTSKQKAFKVINEVQVQMKLAGKKIYLPSRVRRGIAERVGRIIRGQYKRKQCYDDCMKVLEQVGLEVSERELVRIVLQIYKTKKNYPFYKKVMVQQTIQMIKNWHKKLALDFKMFSYYQLVQPKIKQFVFPFGVDDGRVLQYTCDRKSIQYRIKLPVVPQPKDRNDWKWFEKCIFLPEKIQKKIETSLNHQPKRPIMLRKILKGGLEYFFLQFPWEFPKKRRMKVERMHERVLAVDLGLKKLGTAVVCEKGKQLSKPIFLKLIGGQYQHIERLYKHIAGIQKQLARQRNKDLSENIILLDERNRLYNKRNRLGEELAHLTSNLLIHQALDWHCTKIIIEDLRSYKPPRGRRSWSRRLSEWLRGRITRFLEYKCQEVELLLQKVYPWNTSSHCPRCTKKGKKVLGPNNLITNQKGRWFYCPHCQFSADRDYIAALNIYRASFINYIQIKSLKDTNPIPYQEMGTLHSTVPSGGTEMTHTNGLVVVTGRG